MEEAAASGAGKRGTAERNAELAAARLQNAKGKEAKRKKKLPTLGSFRAPPEERAAGNGEKWEGIPPPEARRRDGLKRASAKAFWGKAPAARLAIEAGRVFTLLEPGSLAGNKNKALEKEIGRAHV